MILPFNITPGKVGIGAGGVTLGVGLHHLGSAPSARAEQVANASKPKRVRTHKEHIAEFASSGIIWKDKVNVSAYPDKKVEGTTVVIIRL